MANIFELAAREQAVFTNVMADYGYQTKTTFWQDFYFADHLNKGAISAIKDTCKRAFEGWKHDYKYLTELVLVLNHKIWYWHGKNEALAQVYNALWEKYDHWCLDHLKGEEKDYFISTLD